MSQVKLGQALGLTFQQVQKNERGTNRIGSSRLFELSRILDVPLPFFFDKMPPEVASKARKGKGGLAERVGPAYETETLARRETLELIRNYYQIVDPKVRKRMFELVKALSRAATGGKRKK